MNAHAPPRTIVRARTPARPSKRASSPHRRSGAVSAAELKCLLARGLTREDWEVAQHLAWVGVASSEAMPEFSMRGPPGQAIETTTTPDGRCVPVSARRP